MSNFDTAAARARCITALEDGDPCEATWAGHELAALDRIDELERANVELDAARCTHPTDLGVVYHSERDLLKRIAELERQRDAASAAITYWLVRKPETLTLVMEAALRDVHKALTSNQRQDDSESATCVCGHRRDLHLNSGWCLACKSTVNPCFSYKARGE